MSVTVGARRAPLRILAVLAAVLVGLFGVVASTTPAHAGTGEMFCVMLKINGQWQLFCREIPYAVTHDLGCPSCNTLDLDFDRPDPELSVDREQMVGQAVVNGVVLLGQAGVATDPALAQRLRTEALNRFTAAAAALGTTTLTLPAVGYVDRGGSFSPEPVPWLAGVGVDLVGGVSDLQRSGQESDPVLNSAWRLRAQHSFDDADRGLRRGCPTPCG
jgi:hypothetical protein